MEEILIKGYLKYAILILGGIGVLGHFITSMAYHRLIKESENVPASKAKLIKQMRLKFENCYRLNLGVNNIKAFVDKYLYRYRICGISLHAMQKVTPFCAWSVSLLGLAGGAACQLLNYDYVLGIKYEVMGIGMMIILLTLYLLFDLHYDRNVLATNMIDFLENSLVNRLAHEYAGGMKDLTPEEKAIMNEIPTLQQAITHEKVQKPVMNRNMKHVMSKELKRAYDPDIIQDIINQYLP